MQNAYLSAYPYSSSVQIHSNISELGFVLETPVLGIDFPNIRLAQYDKPGEDGSIVSNQFLGGRDIILKGRVSGNTINQYQANRRILEQVIGVFRNSLSVAQPALFQFETMDGLLLQAYVYLAKKPDVIERSLNHGAFQFQLFAPDNNLYAQSAQVSTITVPSGGGVTYPVIYPVTYGSQTGGSLTATNNGNSRTFPILTFNGPLTSPLLKNLTTGDAFQVDFTLGSTDVLIVDMQAKTMLLNGSTNALQYFDPINSWMYFAPGANVLKLTSGISADTGNVTVSFRDAYFGA